MDEQGKRHTAIGLAATFVATILSKVSGMSDSLVISVLAVGALASIAWGWWPEIRRGLRFDWHRYTSAGLTWKVLDSDDGRCILQIRQAGTELPQPLFLRVRSSSPLRHGYCSFYPDSRFLDKQSGGPIEAELRGKEALFVVREPKLHEPAMLSIVVLGKRGELVTVEDVKRRVS